MMNKKTVCMSICLLICLACFPAQILAEDKTQEIKNPVVVLSTNMGNITIELNKAKAPVSVKNFLDYAESGFYKDTIFHRVIPGFMIQGGGLTSDMKKKPTKAAIKNEADNGLSNKKGTLAMARTSVVDSATSQFFINLSDNTFLDHGVRDYGYAVFGKVIAGMETVEKIGKLKTRSEGGHQNVPRQPVIITGIVKK